MLKKIFFLFQTNILIALLNLAITILTAKFLGAAGRGELTLIITYIAFIQIINEVLGTSSIYYMLNRFRVSEIVSISIIWFLVISISGTSLLILFKAIDADLGLLACLTIFSFAIHNLLVRIVLNKVNLRWFNLINVLQPLIIIVLIFLAGYEKLNVNNFLLYQLCSYFSLLILSSILLQKHFNKIRYEEIKPLISEGFRLGLTNQAANLSQILNYRIAYLFLQKFWSLSSVGIFSIVLSVVNVIWLFSNTIATLLYNEVARTSSSDRRIKLTINGVIATLIVTTGILAVFLIIPTNFYTYLFHKDFVDLKRLVLIMSPSIIIFSLSRVVSHYFSGMGLVKYNFLSSFIGLIATLILAPFFIREFNIVGAAISNSVSYIVSAIVIFYFFMKKNYHLNK